ncbi:hypothetical protein MSG28_013049 [Choristoneura fumiferana]|uniref:Uncharacterized protein n=1 Tax=Choristoneura fumiferana TaxID=7141 RepID=A0ACC0KRQ8_CHOFU|nr:hypothetical protein MSG28_013049 [Choristoneura fumiferana]
MALRLASELGVGGCERVLQGWEPVLVRWQARRTVVAEQPAPAATAARQLRTKQGLISDRPRPRKRRYDTSVNESVPVLMVLRRARAAAGPHTRTLRRMLREGEGGATKSAAQGVTCEVHINELKEFAKKVAGNKQLEIYKAGVPANSLRKTVTARTLTDVRSRRARSPTGRDPKPPPTNKTPPDSSLQRFTGCVPTNESQIEGKPPKHYCVKLQMLS